MACEIRSPIEWYNDMSNCCRHEAKYTLWAATKSAPFAVGAFFLPPVFGMLGMVWGIASSSIEQLQNHKYEHLRGHFHQGIAAALVLRSVMQFAGKNWMGGTMTALSATLNGLFAYNVHKKMQAVPMPLQPAHNHNHDHGGFPGRGHRLGA